MAKKKRSRPQRPANKTEKRASRFTATQGQYLAYLYVYRKHEDDRQTGPRILRVKVALDRGENPPVADAARAVCAFFRYVEPRAATRLEAAVRRGGDFLDTIHSGRFYGLMPPKGRDLLPFAMDELLASHSLIETLDVIARRFYGVYGMIGSLEEVAEDRVPLGEVYEIAAGFRGDTAEFVRALEGALAWARSTRAGIALLDQLHHLWA